MLIGLNGLKGSGKDTVGSYLVDNYGFERVSFAQKLKESAAALFDIPVDKWEKWKNEDRATITIDADWFDSQDRGPYPAWTPSYSKSVTVREFLQRYGTEAHRTIFGSDFWVKEAMKGLNGNKKYVFTDARFENELQRIKSVGGYNVQILRPGVFTADSHVSEAPPPQHLIDYAIDNDGGFDKLYAQVDDFVTQVLPVVYGVRV